MSVLDDLDRLPWPKAADKIDEVGWTQHQMVAPNGAVCETGALRACVEVSGDWAIAREVARHRGRGESWQDVKGRTKAQVTKWLRTTDPITDDELEVVFGPQWVEIIAMVRCFAAATPEQQQAYRTACWNLWRQPNSPYQRAYRAVFVGGGPGVAARRALRAFGGLDYYAVVASALARRHEIGQPGGITQEDYDVLCGPWRSQGWIVHPDDEVA